MTRKVSLPRLLLASALTMCAFGDTALAGKDYSTVLAVPARQRLVQLGQDMYRIRRMTLVSYQRAAGSDAPALHTWDGSNWSAITIEDYRSALPDMVVLIGDQKTLPASLVDASARCNDLRKIESFDVTAVATELGKMLDLKPNEVLWIAKKNGLTATDRNADRRRYGRYGKPVSEETAGEPGTVSVPATMPPEPDVEPIRMDPIVPGKAAPADAPAPAVRALEPVAPVPEKPAKKGIPPEDK